MELNEKQALLYSLREIAKQGRDPTAADETLDYILNLIKSINPKRILEIGAAEGLTSCAMALNCNANITAIELTAERACTARENFERFGVAQRVTLHEGDAAEILPMVEGKFDLIFLDGPKVQYLRYLPECKRLLSKNGYLLSDDVLLFGWVDGSVPTPAKRRMLVEHIREYLAVLQADEDFQTQILPLGEGLAVSKKIN